MRLLVVASILAFGIFALVRTVPPRSGITQAAQPLPNDSTRVDFATQVRPILEKCQPCHFSGGRMYDRLPFDRPETIRKLGTKLFTRIRNENERGIIREFLAQDEKQ